MAFLAPFPPTIRISRYFSPGYLFFTKVRQSFSPDFVPVLCYLLIRAPFVFLGITYTVNALVPLPPADTEFVRLFRSSEFFPPPCDTRFCAFFFFFLFPNGLLFQIVACRLEFYVFSPLSSRVSPARLFPSYFEFLFF